jgi:uncharacterized Tic20 family protein
MTEQTTGISQLLGRWLLGIETQVKDLVQPTPGTLATTAAADREALPARDLDRLWAAAAHLAGFGGLWLIAPILIYLLHRQGSPFVRWHAFQASVLAVWTICAGFLAGLLLGLFGVVFLLLSHLGLAGVGTVLVGIGALPLVFVIVFSAVVSAIGGIKSLAGRPWTMPIIGRIASGVIARRSGAVELPDGSASR